MAASAAANTFSASTASPISAPSPSIRAWRPSASTSPTRPTSRNGPSGSRRGRRCSAASTSCRPPKRREWARAMPRVAFTGHLRRYLDLSEIEVEGATVGAALARVFERQPKLRAYVLDEQGHVRQHVSIYVGGSQIVDREKLSDAVGAGDEIYVLQALSGG